MHWTFIKDIARAHLAARLFNMSDMKKDILKCSTGSQSQEGEILQETEGRRGGQGLRFLPATGACSPTTDCASTNTSHHSLLSDGGKACPMNIPSRAG